MKRKLLSLLALLCLTVSGAWADNEQGPTYTITLSGCDNTSFNITVNNATLPYVIDKIGELSWKLDAPTVIHPYCIDFTDVFVKSGGEGKVSVDWVWNKMTITITGAFQGKATIQCDGEGYDPYSDEPYSDSRDIYVTCVSNGPYTVASGNCGTSGHEAEVTWSLTSDGVLTISGSGAMTDYSDASDQPWSSNRSDIKTIVIENGVTSIGNHAFDNCEYATSVSIPASVTSIGYYSFGYCYGISSLTIAENSSLETIGSNAFYCCSSLSSVTIPASVTSIGNSAFESCTLLTTVTLNSNPSIGTDAFGSAAVTMNLTANNVDGTYWMTFCNNQYNFQADENTEVFKVALSGTALTMNKVEGRIVNAGTAVVLKSTGNPVMTLTSSSSSDGQTNNLIGVTTLEKVTANGTHYVLNNDEEGVGFYKMESGYKIDYGKAYLTSTTGARGFFLFDEATGIESVSLNDGENGEVYDLQGRRVSQPAKGLYIVNGKKYIKK